MLLKHFNQVSKCSIGLILRICVVFKRLKIQMFLDERSLHLAKW